MRESLTRASILTFLSSNLVFLVGLIVSVLIARALGPAGKGIYAVFLNTSGLLVVPAAAVETSLLYVIAQRRPDREALNRFVWRAAVVQGIVTVGLLAVMIRVPRVRHFLFPGLPDVALLVLLALIMFGCWERYRATLLPGIQRYGRFTVLSAATVLASTALVAAVIIGFWLAHRKLTVNALVVATTGGTIVSALLWQRLTAATALPDTEPTTASAIAREVRLFGTPVLARTLLEFASYRVDVYLVNALAGARSLGLYTIAIGGGQQLLSVPFALANPLYSRIAHDGDTPETRETTRYAFKVSGLISIGLAAVAAATASFLLPLVYGRAFTGAVLPLLVFLPGVVVSGATRVFNSYFIGCRRNGETVKAELVGLAAIVSLDLLLVPHFGTTGAAATASVAYASSSLVLTYRFVQISHSPWMSLFSLNASDRQRLARAWSAVSTRLRRPRWAHTT